MDRQDKLRCPYCLTDNEVPDDYNCSDDEETYGQTCHACNKRFEFIVKVFIRYDIIKGKKYYVRVA